MNPGFGWWGQGGKTRLPAQAPGGLGSYAQQHGSGCFVALVGLGSFLPAPLPGLGSGLGLVTSGPKCLEAIKFKVSWPWCRIPPKQPNSGKTVETGGRPGVARGPGKGMSGWSTGFGDTMTDASHHACVRMALPFDTRVSRAVCKARTSGNARACAGSRTATHVPPQHSRVSTLHSPPKFPVNLKINI